MRKVREANCAGAKVGAGKELYICHTYYHVLITLVKAILNKNKPDLLLTEEKDLIENAALVEKLKKSGLFNRVFVVDYLENHRSGKATYGELSYFEKYILLREKTQNPPVDFSAYDEVYIFSDNILTGKILNSRGVKYNLIEDGTDMFKNNQAYIRPKASIGTLMKKLLRVPTGMARSENIKSIEVNDKNGLAISHPNIIEVPRKELLAKLSKAERKKIFEIFLDEKDFLKSKNAIIILTQPFWEDRSLESEEAQLKLYGKIIEEQCGCSEHSGHSGCSGHSGRGDKVIIKIHPRDHADYSSLASERVSLVAEKFPIEILNFRPGLKFKKAITVSSTAINLLENCEERVFLGWGYLERFKTAAE